MEIEIVLRVLSRRCRSAGRIRTCGREEKRRRGEGRERRRGKQTYVVLHTHTDTHTQLNSQRKRQRGRDSEEEINRRGGKEGGRERERRSEKRAFAMYVRRHRTGSRALGREKKRRISHSLPLKGILCRCNSASTQQERQEVDSKSLVGLHGACSFHFQKGAFTRRRLGAVLCIAAAAFLAA